MRMRLSSRSYFVGMLIIPLVSSSPLWAGDDCAPVRLDDEGGTFFNVPVHDQTYGSCSIETVTQFMEAVVKKQGLGETRVSVLETMLRAAEASADPESRKFNGYYTSLILDQAFNQGICSQAQVSKNLKIGKLDELKLLELFTVFLERSMTIQRGELSTRKSIDSRFQERQRLTPVDNVDMGLNHRNYQSLQDFVGRQINLQIGEVQDSVRNVAGMNLELLNKRKYSRGTDSFLKKFKDTYPLICAEKDRIFLKNYYSLEYMSYKNTANHFQTSDNTKSGSVVERVNAHLNAPSALPIPISYCVAPIQDGKGVKSLPIVNGRLNDSLCGNHASLIIGQRKNKKTNRCEYLIRNSWGTEEHSSKSDSEGVSWEGTPYTEQRMVSFGFGFGRMMTVSGKKNLTGNFWVDRNDFVDHLLYDLYLYQDPGPNDHSRKTSTRASLKMPNVPISSHK